MVINMGSTGHTSIRFLCDYDDSTISQVLLDFRRQIHKEIEDLGLVNGGTTSASTLAPADEFTDEELMTIKAPTAVESHVGHITS
jgi:hypothetical protein